MALDDFNSDSDSDEDDEEGWMGDVGETDGKTTGDNLGEISPEVVELIDEVLDEWVFDEEVPARMVHNEIVMDREHLKYGLAHMLFKVNEVTDGEPLPDS